MKQMGARLFIGMLLLWAPSFAVADEASKNAKIEEMMQLTHVDQMMTQMLGQMKTMAATEMKTSDIPTDARAHAEEMQKKMMDLLADRLSWEKAKPAYIKVYADTFTEGEIDGIVTFYKSPAGHAMLDKMPQLMEKSMAVGQQLMGDVMPEVKRMMEEMKQQDEKK